MDWNPDSVTQDQLHAYRQAAEAAWGDDTRHESLFGAPEPSAGQCYVTSRWLTTKLGGQVGSKDGHYFWVSPDRSHVIDLTGDQFAYKPADLRFNGVKLDEEDEPWEYDEEQKTHRPGPIMFKRADHPLYKGFRTKTFKTENPRVRLFADRADQALSGNFHQGASKAFLRTAEFGWGGDSHPGQEPQVVNRMEHDRPGGQDEHYKWVYANGRLELDPEADYDSITDFVGATDSNQRPVALGRVSVSGGKAQWEVSGNLGLAGLARVLHHHTRQAGWEWGGLKSLNDGQRLAYTMWWLDDDGHLLLSHTRLPGAKRLDVIGKVAHTRGDHEGLRQWADDHKLALNTLNKPVEDIDGYDTYGPRPDYAQGPTNTTPPAGTLRCPECGQVFPSFGQYILHRKEEEPRGDELDREDGHFPEMDMDQAIPPHFHEREPFSFPLAHTASVLDAHDNKGWHWSSDARQHFGAYLDGNQIGVLTVSNTGAIMDATVTRAPERAFASLVASAARRYDELTYDGEDPVIKARLTLLGFVMQPDGPYMKWAKGKEPMDMIKDPIPFIFDLDKDTIQVGQPGQNPHSIIVPPTPGKENEPSPIVQGAYEPGGVITITDRGSGGFSVRHLVDLWYWSYPSMRVTDVQYTDPMGQTQKLTKTAQNVGAYVKQLAATDPAVWGAYQALDAGGADDVDVVGGAVRDPLMGIEPNDIDLLVTGLPSEKVHNILKKLPGKVDLTGKSFGVYRYNYKGHEVEIALPRTERSTGDRRVDFDVNVDHTLPVEDDLLRRDFTVNSMAVSLKTGRLIDPFGGAEDIKNKVLRTTHPSSFKEDPTRTLRALVMNARYGLVPDERTRSEMEQNAGRIHNESWENMKGIWDKLLKADNPARAIRLAQETGVLKHVLPELSSAWDFDQKNPHHSFPLGTHHMHVLEGVQEASTDPDLRFAAMIHDIGKPSSQWIDDKGVGHYYQHPERGGQDHDIVGAHMATERLRHMHWPVKRTDRIHDLIRHHMFPAFSSAKGARKFLNRVGPHADDLMLLRHADMYGKGTDEYQGEKTPVEAMGRLVDQARSTNAPTALSGLAINGKDILAQGIKPGPEVGQILNGLMQAVIENPDLNTRESLLALVQESQSSGTPAPAAFT